MSNRNLKSAPIVSVPGVYRVTWSADFAAESPEAAAVMARGKVR